MVSTLIEEKIYTPEEYLAIEEVSSAKHQYLNGKIIEMSGGTANHNLIAANIITALNIALEEKSIQHLVYTSDMKIQIPKLNHFVYPDAVVVCEKPVFYNNRKDVIINPLLIVEVLSPSSEEKDRNLKFFEYRTLPSFKEYVLVSQEKALVSTFYQEKTKTWVETEAEGTDNSIYLSSIDCHISLKRVFKGVEFA